jgi:uncharacterized protein
MNIIGKVAATEKNPTTIDDFYFWTNKDRILNPFDVIKVNHINNTITFGVIEEISHITDTPSYLTSFISCDFGDVNCALNTQRIGMNFVKARVVGNTGNIFTPVLDGSDVSFANEVEIKEALGLSRIENEVLCGYIDMYEYDLENRVSIPVHFNSKFLIGPEGAHLNISGISGLAAKTSYAMFLLKGLQDKYFNEITESTAFIVINVKGKDLLAIDEPNSELSLEAQEKYKNLGIEVTPFKNVKYFYPNSTENYINTNGKDQLEIQRAENKGFVYKYTFEEDKNSLDMLFANIDDPQQTMESICNYIQSEQGGFNNIQTWKKFEEKLEEYCAAGRQGTDKEITVSSWRKFKRIISKAIKNPLFVNSVNTSNHEVRLKDAVKNLKRNDVYVIDIARLDEVMQGFVFGDIINSVYELKLGQLEGVREEDIPNKILLFVDELNKYASTDVPKNSPILRQIIDITERGRSLGIVLFSAEQFKSAIHDRVKGNCSSHAFGRTNAIEISKNDYKFIPPVYKNMMTRLKQGEYIVQNPIFRSLLNIKFPEPLYKQFK